MLRDIEAITTILDVTKQIIIDSLNTSFKDFKDVIQYNTTISNKKNYGHCNKRCKGI
jgi:hypothetical protein